MRVVQLRVRHHAHKEVALLLQALGGFFVDNDFDVVVLFLLVFVVVDVGLQVLRRDFLHVGQGVIVCLAVTLNYNINSITFGKKNCEYN